MNLLGFTDEAETGWLKQTETEHQLQAKLSQMQALGQN